MSAVADCRVCRAPLGEALLDFGPQPLCNRFLRSRDEREYRHPLVLMQCGRCGLLQLGDPVLAAEMAPRFDWITYQEPEGHLDDLVDALCRLPELGPGSVIAGVSYKDDTTLRRFGERGIKGTWRLEPRADLGIDGKRVEIETVQDRLGPETARRALGRRPRADLVVARHILEHAHDTARFLETLALLARPAGRVVCEVPDCARSLELLDYTVLWEEHVLYFTAATFRRAFLAHGMPVELAVRYPYPLEDSLVAVARPGGDAAAPPLPPETLETELARGRRFATGFPARRKAWRERLAGVRTGGGKVALLGAGHLACTFLNLFGLEDLVAFVADDNPDKAGLYLPGSRLPVRPSTALAEEGVHLCLLAVSAAAEGKVVERHPDFLARGGGFASIFPASARALLP